MVDFKAETIEYSVSAQLDKSNDIPHVEVCQLLNKIKNIQQVSER